MLRGVRGSISSPSFGVNLVFPGKANYLPVFRLQLTYWLTSWSSTVVIPAWLCVGSSIRASWVWLCLPKLAWLIGILSQRGANDFQSAGMGRKLRDRLLPVLRLITTSTNSASSYGMIGIAFQQIMPRCLSFALSPVRSYALARLRAIFAAG